MRPRHPCHGNLGSGLTAERGGILAFRRNIGIEGRDVPRAADHRHDGAASDAASDLLAHVRLAAYVVATRRHTGAYGSHRVGDRVEDRLTVAAMLDEVVPPPLGIAFATGCRQLGERVDRRLVASERSLGERDCQREVNRLQLDAALRRPRGGLPLGAERRQRCEHRPLRLGYDVAEQRHRWNQPSVPDPAQRVLGIDGRLDEHDVRLQVVECPAHRTGRSRTVVADAEKVQTLVPGAVR